MPIDSDENSEKANLFWSVDGKTWHPFNPEPVTLFCSTTLSEEDVAKSWAQSEGLEIMPNEKGERQ